MSVYKLFTENPAGVASKTILHEAIPITGTIISGTYGTFPSESNIKYFSSDDFILVTDYPYASSSANNLFTLTAGQASGTTSEVANTQLAKKNNIYRLYAQQFVGYDVDQNFVPFNASGVLNPANTWDPDKMSDLVFLDFDRVIVKDGIQKGSFQITMGTASYANPMASTKIFSDAYVNSSDPATYRSNSPMGDYAFLQEGTQSASVPTETTHGFIFYDAGLIVLAANTQTFGTELTSGSSFATTTAQTPNAAMLSGSINDFVNGVRAHIQNIEFNNNIELNSTYYFCRANHGEFNYSSNPSYTSGSRMVVKNVASDPARAYITSVGLYDDENQLLAVAKLSTPLEKNPEQEITLKVRLDY